MLVKALTQLADLGREQIEVRWAVSCGRVFHVRKVGSPRCQESCSARKPKILGAVTVLIIYMIKDGSIFRPDLPII